MNNTKKPSPAASHSPSMRMLSFHANDLYVIEGLDDDGRKVTKTEECEGAYIIRAVNSHAALVEALEDAGEALKASGLMSYGGDIHGRIARALKLTQEAPR